MMHIAIATSYPTPATFDAGRLEPFSYIPFNTPPTKTKKSVTGRKQIAGDVFCPLAISTPRKTPFNRPKANDLGDDEDLPLALVRKLRSVPLTPTVTRPEVNDDEDLPLVKIKERMMKKFDLRPIIKRVVRCQPPIKPKKVVQTVRDLGPRSTAMMCIVSDCPYDWHVHRVWTNTVLFLTDTDWHGNGDWRQKTEDTTISQKTIISADGQIAFAVKEVGVQRFDAGFSPSSVYARTTAPGGVRRI